jgi:hypothetical protein
MKDIIRKKRTLPTELDQERFGAIFARLEDDPEKPQSKRVEKILESLSGLRDDLDTREKVRVITGLRNALSRYQWVSRVAPTHEGFRVVPAIADRANLSNDDVWEYEAVRDLLDTVPHLGKRPRIRRCAECRRWFFGVMRDDQQYCSGNCRQRRYDNDPEKRDKKLAHMKKLYADEKARKRNPKSGVGLHRKPKKPQNPPKKSQ